MTSQFVEGVAFDAIKTIVLVAGPTLGVALVVGLAVSIVQATTQINEMTLAFVPKILAVFLTIVVAAGYMIDRLTGFASAIFSDFSRFVH